MLLASLTYLLAAIVLLLGWLRGGMPERHAALAILVWLIVDPLFHAVFATPEFARIDWALFTFDGLLAGTLIAIALHANRMWPIFAASFSIIPVLCHVAVLLNRAVVPQAYWALEQLPFLFVLLSLLLGVSAHRQRLLNGTRCADWSGR